MRRVLLHYVIKPLAVAFVFHIIKNTTVTFQSCMSQWMQSEATIMQESVDAVRGYNHARVSGCSHRRRSQWMQESEAIIMQESVDAGVSGCSQMQESVGAVRCRSQSVQSEAISGYIIHPHQESIPSM